MRDQKDFLSRLVTMDETWLYHYDQEGRQKSMEGGVAAHPATTQKIPSAKISWKSSRLFLGIKTASSSLITFQSAKLSTRSITHVCWFIWKTFWRKNAASREGDQIGSCSCKTMPRLTRNLQPIRNWPTWASNILITHPILWILPGPTATYYTTESSLFLSKAEAIASSETRLDGQYSEFLWVACRS